MDAILQSVFRVSLAVKFSNTDVDHDVVMDKIKQTKLFNIKKKTNDYITFEPNELIHNLQTLIYKNEIFIFREITIYVTNETTFVNNYQINIEEFSSEIYKDTLQKIHKDTLLVINEKYSFFKSLILNDYIEDKVRADIYFANSRYKDAHAIYCKYNGHNDFSHYCIEMSVYCKLALGLSFDHGDVDDTFIDTFYHNRLIYVLYLSKSYDFLVYELLSKAKTKKSRILFCLGQRFIATKILHRKGVELLYFHATSDMDICNVTDVLKNIRDTEMFLHNKEIERKNEDVLVESLENVKLSTNEYETADVCVLEEYLKCTDGFTRAGTYAQHILRLLSNINFFSDQMLCVLQHTEPCHNNDETVMIERDNDHRIHDLVLDLQDEYKINQYQKVKLSIKVSEYHKNYYYVVNNRKYNLKNQISIRACYRKQGVFYKKLVIYAYKKYEFFVKFVVRPFFVVSQVDDHRIRSLFYINIVPIHTDRYTISALELFSVVHKGVHNFFSENVVGYDDILEYKDSLDVVNAPVYCDLRLSSFLQNQITQTTFYDSILLQAHKNFKYKFTIKRQSKARSISNLNTQEIYKINLCNTKKTKCKLFILIFNNYKLQNSTKINVLVCNYRNAKYKMKISSKHINIYNTEYRIKEKCCNFIEMKCTVDTIGLKCEDVRFDIQITNTTGEFIDYDMLIKLR